MRALLSRGVWPQVPTLESGIEEAVPEAALETTAPPAGDALRDLVRGLGEVPEVLGAPRRRERASTRSLARRSLVASAPLCARSSPRYFPPSTSRSCPPPPSSRPSSARCATASLAAPGSSRGRATIKACAGASDG